MDDFPGKLPTAARAPCYGQCMTKTDDLERFQASYTRAAPDECWTWKGNKNGTYPRFTAGGRRVGAQRYALKAAGQSIPPNYSVVRKCSGVLCVNPAHLDAVPRHEASRMGGKTQRKAPPEHVGWIAEHPDGLDVRLFRRRPPATWRNVRMVYAGLPAAPATM